MPLCVPHLLAGRWEMSLWYETLFIEWSDLFCLHTIHPSTLQFSLGAGFNIGQNAICIYISFFIRPGPLSPLKTLGIWRKSVAANLKKGDKGSPCFAFYLYICFSLPYYPAFCLYWSTFCTIIIKPFLMFCFCFLQRGYSYCFSYLAPLCLPRSHLQHRN